MSVLLFATPSYLRTLQVVTPHAAEAKLTLKLGRIALCMSSLRCVTLGNYERSRICANVEEKASSPLAGAKRSVFVVRDFSAMSDAEVYTSIWRQDVHLMTPESYPDMCQCSRALCYF